MQCGQIIVDISNSLPTVLSRQGKITTSRELREEIIECSLKKSSHKRVHMATSLPLGVSGAAVSNVSEDEQCGFPKVTSAKEGLCSLR